MPIKTTLPEGGLDRLVGHVDDLVEGQAPELHVHVDGPHHLAEGQRAGGRVVRRGARRTRSRARETADKNHCETSTPTDEEYFDQVAYWTTPTKDCGDDRGAVCKDYSEWVAGLDGDQGLTAGRCSDHRCGGPRTPARPPWPSVLCAGPRLRLGLLLAGPIGWLVVAYLGSLAVLFVAAFWHAGHVHRRDRPATTGSRTSRRSLEQAGLPHDRAADGRRSPPR